MIYYFDIFRGSKFYEIDSLLGTTGLRPLHLFLAFQYEETFTTQLNLPETNPYRFDPCDLSAFCFRLNDFRLPNSIFNTSGMYV